MDTTVVSFYFDLGKIENNPLRKQLNNYKSVAEKMLSRKVNLFFMGSKDILDFVKEVRSKYNLLHKTYLHEFNFEESDYYKYLPVLQQIYEDKGLNSMKDTKMTPHYFVCIYTKFQAMKLAIEKNPFKTSNFCWVDFGVFHICSDISNAEFVENLNHFDTEKVKVILLRSIDRESIRNRKEFYLKDNYVVTAQIFGGNSVNLLKFVDKFNKELEYSFEIGLPTNEENIMAVVCAENENDFDVGMSFYSSCLFNFSCIKKKYENLLSYISQLRFNAYNKYAYQLIMKAFDGMYRDYFTLTNEEIYRLYTELIIVSYYAVGIEKYRKYVGEFKSFCVEYNMTIDEATSRNLVY